MSTLRHARAFSALALAGVMSIPGLGGCTDGTAPLTVADFIGTYRLQSIGGQALPVRIPGSAIVFYAQSYEFRADSTYREVAIQGRYDQTSRDTVYGGGTWTFRPRSLGGQDALWQNPGFGGTARGVRLPYKIRDGGRTLYDDQFDDGSPMPAWVWTKQ